MPADLAHEMIELTANADGDPVSARLPYVVTGADSETEAITASKAASSSRWNGMFRDRFELGERRSPDTWLVYVVYRGIEGDAIQSFDTTGGTVHITQALSTVAVHSAAGLTAPQLNGAIGVEGTEPGSPVQGADIPTSSTQFSEVHYLTATQCSPAYRRVLSRNSAKWNTAPFRGYDPAEVLFLGSVARRSGEGKGDAWQVEFRFVVSPNRRGFLVGDIYVPIKRGWDYLWTQYRDELDVGAAGFTKKPAHVFIQRVLEGFDFALLRIGTGER